MEAMSKKRDMGRYGIHTERHPKDDVIIIILRGADGLILHNGEP